MKEVQNAILERLGGDRVIWMVIVCLSLFSLLAVWSSTGTLAHVASGSYTFKFIIKHLAILCMGLGIIFVAHLLDFRYYSRVAQILLFISVPLLVYTLFFGTEINSAKRWVTVPMVNITFQTSDLAKLALIMYLARLLSMKQEVIKSFKEAFLPILGAVSLVCVLIAPADLSTALVLFSTCILLMFIGRIDIKYIAGLVGLAVLAVGLFVALLFIMPEDKMQGRMLTWKNRIVTFTAEDAPIPYQVKQANIAIAKGGLIRLAPGDSIQRNYLPHPYSDFIYAIIIEEYGLLGGLVVIFLYLLLLYRCIKIVLKSPKAFGALLAVGLSLSLVIQAMINMGVAVNLLPVTGMTLPLISMGGSSIWFTSLALGIILSVSNYIEKNKKESIEENLTEEDIQVAVA